MTTADPDPYLWLEEVDGEAALAWAREQNAGRAAGLTANPVFETTKARIREILDADDKIPFVTKRGRHYDNFWTDAGHERGLWRRTTAESFRSETTDWEVLLDLDALAEAEDTGWVWHGAAVWRDLTGAETATDPGADRFPLAMVALSPGGTDADVSREFDLRTRRFVPDGFSRPLAKGGVAWEDPDTLLVFTDFGEGSMTSSGYPRMVRRWRRGTPLGDATAVFEADADVMAVAAGRDTTPGHERTYVSVRPTFWTSRLYVLGDDDTPTLIDSPLSAEDRVNRGWLTIELRDDWTVGNLTHPAGSLLGTRLSAFLAGERDLQVLYSPAPTTSLAGMTWTRNHLVLTILDDVTNRLEVLTPRPTVDDRAGGGERTGDTEDPVGGVGPFVRRAVADPGQMGTIEAWAVDPLAQDDLWLVTTGFLSPTALSIGSISDDGRLGEPEHLKTSPAWFDTDGLVAEQHFATSADGTRVPYFLVRRADAPADGTTPTLLYGYGGFEIPMTPSYSGALGSGWLTRGGAYAVANIRGGGEYGPAWHQAALRQHRHRAYEDMAAVAEDLIASGLTSPRHLAVQGGSNGGLMAGNMLVRRPELFGAVVIEVPLLDMRRYHHLLAGASWMEEYGDPDDPDQWAYIRTFSPYHLVDPAVSYPPVLFTTSTRDDRVHPGHARKMAALMLDAGQDVTYYENIEGGHGGSATNEQAAHRAALVYTFLAERIGPLPG
ncbi:MAG: prolyl oligopeptidase family serine peptidase [Acidimicrobiales bacterium]